MRDDADYTEFVVARWPTLVRSTVLLGCTRPEAEDIVQTALLRCYVNWSKVQRATDRESYVFRILLNTLNDARRRHWSAERPTAELPDGVEPDTTEQALITDAIDRALGGLSDEHRTVVVMRFYLHLTEHQMADVLRVAPGTVKSRLSRALRVLADDVHIVEIGEPQ